MRKLCIFIFTLLVVLRVVGQEGMSGLRSLSAGVSAGINIADMRLSASCYDVYRHHVTAHPVTGLWFQYRTWFGLSLRPEFRYIGRGANLEWLDVNYRLRAYCVDMRFSLIYNVRLKSSPLSPYLVAAPIWNSVWGGDVRYTADDTGNIEMALSRSNMRVHDFALFLGVGLEYPLLDKSENVVISGEVGYNWGFVDSFTAVEKNGNITVLNYSIDQSFATGSRLARGIEVTIRVGISFGKEAVHKKKIKVSE